MLDVVGICELEVTQQHFVDRQVGSWPDDGSWESPAIGEPLRDEPVVLRTALFGTETAQVEVPAVQGDNSLPTRFVETIGRGSNVANGHGPTSKSGRVPAFLE